MKIKLTKSLILDGLRCPKKLWLKSNQPELAAAPSETALYLQRQGQEIGRLACLKFPGGVFVDEKLPESACQVTAELIENNCNAIFEGAFYFDDIFIRADILQRAGKHWELIEVKSVVELRADHLKDLAIQYYVLRRLGLPVNKASIMFLDREAGFAAADPFKSKDFTEEADSLLGEISDSIDGLKQIIEQQDPPKMALGRHCGKKPFDCPFKKHCWEGVPRHSIFNVPRLNSKIREQLAAEGKLSLQHLPAEAVALLEQKKYLTCVKTGQPIINLPAIKQQLSQLKFPLHFFDFETDATALPKIPGLRPFQQVPFQYSLHILASTGELRHLHYLHTENSDPRQKLINSLLGDISDTGSVVVYHAQFEKSVLHDLAQTFPQYKMQLRSIISRLWDQLEIFKKFYSHPDFLGSNSIKNILPVIAPELSYQDLMIQHGSDAQAGWNRMVSTEEISAKNEIIKGLLEYCKRDTLAMVKIHQHLVNLQ